MGASDPHTMGITRESRQAERNANAHKRIGTLERRGGGGVSSGSISGVVNELIDDRVAALLQEGYAVTLTYNDSLGELEITVNLGEFSLAKGDLLVGTGGGTAVRLPVGVTDQVLTVDPSAPTGLKWGTVSPPAPLFTVTNLVSDFILDVDSTTLNEVAMVLGGLVTGFTAVPLAGYTITGETPLRTLDCAAVTLNQLADVLGSVIEDLAASNIGNYTVTNLIPDRGYDATSTSLTEMAHVLGTFINDRITAGDFT
jgi:hypothetical protein